MAEERISIHHCSNKCRYLREISCDILIEDGMSNGTYCSAYIHGTWQKIDPEKDCKNCKRAEYDGISRTEAIEKMAKAVCMRAMYGCKRCVFGKDKEKCEEWIAFNHIRDAEAALDALVDK